MLRRLTFGCMVIMLACTNTHAPKVSSNQFDWSADSIKNYYLEHIANYKRFEHEHPDSLWNFNTFSKYVLGVQHAKNAGDPLLYALEESYIDATQIPNNKQWLRVTVYPTFNTPYCLILEKNNNKSMLTFKTTNGKGGFYYGYLDFMNTKEFTKDVYDSISNQLKRLNIRSWTENTRCKSCCDGEDWTIEFIENGRYTIHFMDSPFYNKQPKDSVLSVLVKTIRDSAQFKQYMSLKEDKSIKDIQRNYIDQILPRR